MLISLPCWKGNRAVPPVRMFNGSRETTSCCGYRSTHLNKLGQGVKGPVAAVLRVVLQDECLGTGEERLKVSSCCAAVGKNLQQTSTSLTLTVFLSFSLVRYLVITSHLLCDHILSQSHKKISNEGRSRLLRHTPLGMNPCKTNWRVSTAASRIPSPSGPCLA